MQESKFIKYYMALFFVIPFFFIGFGIKFMVDYRHVDAYGVHLYAEVVGFYEDYDDDGEVSYQPIVIYTLRNGKVVNDTLGFSSSPNPYKVGDQIEVMLFEDDPESVYIKSVFWGTTFPLILIISGVLFLVFLLFVFRKKMSFRRDNNLSSNDSTMDNPFME